MEQNITQNSEERKEEKFLQQWRNENESDLQYQQIPWWKW
jgi:hypothetical protein